MISATIKNIATRSNLSVFKVLQQTSHYQQFAPISCCRHLQNFQLSESPRLKIQNVPITGLLGNKFSYVNEFIFSKSIHTQSSLLFKYANTLEQKVKDDIKNDIKDETKSTVDAGKDEQQQVSLDDISKLGLFARFKKMAKDYWYVLLPVHVASSSLWLVGFYYISKSGVDIIALMETYNFSDRLISPLRDSHLGHVAIAYLLYKIATPARYTITLGGTTFAIKFLSKRGFIKPMPSRDKLVQIYKDKKVEMHQKVTDKVAEKKQSFHDKKQNFQDKKQAFKDKYIKKE